MQNKDFVFVRGDSQNLNFNIKNAVSGTPVDISGWKFYLTLKYDENDSDDNAVYTNDVSITSGSSGIARIVIPNTVTDELYGTYRYDVQSKDSSNIIKTLILGNMEFVGDITRRYS